MSTRITPFLWFDDQAEDAARFYVSVFKRSKIRSVTRYGEDGPGPKGTVMTVNFVLDGQEFTALNGGPHYTISPAVSFVVHCKTQAEVDDYWDKLSSGGKPEPCGWLQDRYGVSWQIVPTILLEYLESKDATRTRRVMQAMMKMVKIDIKTLKEAYERR